MSERLKDFVVMGKIEIDANITIRAKNLTDAVERSMKLKETDFVEILDSWDDGSIHISGVYENI